MSNIDIKISLKSYQPHDSFRRGRLELIFSGEDVYDQLLNSLGRIISKRVPTYAFPPELINIERILPESGYIDSVPFNHDYMKLRLSLFPPMNIDCGLSSLHEKYWFGVDYLDKDRERHEVEKNIEAFVAAKNDSNEIIHITTNDMLVYIDGEEMNQNGHVYNREYPLLVITLRPNEKFCCSMKAVLGVGLRHSIWDGASNFWMDQETLETTGETILCFQSASRMDERVLLKRGLLYFHERILLYKNEIKRLYLLEKEESSRFIITLKNEDHTFGEVINYEIQSHPDIMHSGCKKPDHLINEIVIDCIAFDRSKLLNAIMESIDRLVARIDHITRMIDQLFPVERATGDGELAKTLSKTVSKTDSKTLSKTLSKTDSKKKPTKHEKKTEKKKKH